MIPWIWFRTHDMVQLAYVLVASALFWVAMIPELREYSSLRREGLLPISWEWEAYTAPSKSAAESG